MVSAHISSRIRSIFMASYPHWKTHQGGWSPLREEKNKYFPYFLSTGDNRQSQWTNSKPFHFERQWGSSAQIPVCLIDWAADIKHYWIFPKTWTVGFWNLTQLMKAALKFGRGKCFKCFKSLKWIWFYQVTKAFPWQSEKTALNWNQSTKEDHRVMLSWTLKCV